jgi:hypothetical protein
VESWGSSSSGGGGGGGGGGSSSGGSGGSSSGGSSSSSSSSSSVLQQQRERIGRDTLVGLKANRLSYESERGDEREMKERGGEGRGLSLRVRILCR